MPAVSTPEMAVYRTDPAKVDRFLSVCPRMAVFSCQVNGAPIGDGFSFAYLALPYDNASGTLANARAGMTVDIGTTPGASDVGKVRARLAPDGSNIYIAETSFTEIYIQDNDYITVREEHRPWPKTIKIQPVGGGYAEFKDVIQGYTDQNRYPDPIANVTAKPAGFLDRGQTYRTVTLSGSAVAVAAGTAIVGYSWSVGDCTLAGGSLTDQSIVIRAPLGFRYVYLTVTDDQGNTGIKAFPIWAHNRTGSGTPLTAFAVTKDDREEWREMAFTVFGDDGSASGTVIPEGTLVCYWEEATFGGQPAPSSYIDQALMWTTEDSTALNWDESSYTLSAAGAGWWLNRISVSGGTVTYSASPTTWREMYNPTFSRLCYYALKHHTTALEVCNADSNFGSGSVLRRSHFFSEGTAWAQLKTVLDATLGFAPFSDSLNRIWLRRDASYYTNGAGGTPVSRPSQATTITTLDERDWDGENGLVIGEHFYPECQQVRGGGFSFDGTTDYRFKSAAPGKITGYVAATDDIPGQSLATTNSQISLNRITGLHFARRNNPMPEITLKLLGNYDFIEPAWNERLILNHSSGNVRGLALTNRYFRVRRVSVTHNNDPELPPKEITLTLEAETDGPPGQTVNIETERVVEEDIPQNTEEYVSPTEPPTVLTDALLCGLTTDGIAPPVAGTSDLAALPDVIWQDLRNNLPSGALDARKMALDFFPPITGQQPVTLITADNLYYAADAWNIRSEFDWELRIARADVITAGYQGAPGGEGPFFDLATNFTMDRQYALIRRILSAGPSLEVIQIYTDDDWLTFDENVLFMTFPIPAPHANELAGYPWRIEVNHNSGNIWEFEYFLTPAGEGDPDRYLIALYCRDASLTTIIHEIMLFEFWNGDDGYVLWPPPMMVLCAPFEGNAGETILWRSQGDDLYRFDDPDWDDITLPAHTGDIILIEDYLQDSDVLFVVTDDGEGIRTANANAGTPTWDDFALPGSGMPTSLTIHTFDPNILILTRGDQLWVSDDAGDSWIDATGSLTTFGGLSRINDFVFRGAP